jgi:hypothetical protein
MRVSSFFRDRIMKPYDEEYFHSVLLKYDDDVMLVCVRLLQILRARKPVEVSINLVKLHASLSCLLTSADISSELANQPDLRPFELLEAMSFLIFHSLWTEVEVPIDQLEKLIESDILNCANVDISSILRLLRLVSYSRELWDIAKIQSGVVRLLEHICGKYDIEFISPSTITDYWQLVDAAEAKVESESPFVLN